MKWSLWIIAGVVMLAAEILLPFDLHVAFIGVAAIITGLLVFFDLIPELWMQWLVFPVIGLALLLTLRRRLLAHVHGSTPDRREEMVGESVTMLGDLEPGETGRAEARGSSWSVRNDGDRVLTKGKSYSVDSRDGLTLIVKN